MKNWYNSISRGIRFIFRSKSLTVVNIIGLSVGLFVSLFLLVYLQFEFSYDKHYKDAGRIYRMLSVWEEGQTTVYPICMERLATQLKKEIPEVELVSRLYRSGVRYVSYDEGEYLGVSTYQVDSNFLRIFSFELVFGQLENALVLSGHCVITRTTAERIFGKQVNPVGKALWVKGFEQAYEIAAVIEDLPKNTHFRFDMLTDMPDYGFGGLEYFTYLKFREGINIPEAKVKCNELNKRLLEEVFGDGSVAHFSSLTEPLESLHTSTRANFDLSPTANKSNLIFIILITLFVLGVAVSNFIALYMIQGEKRTLEISMRKTAGAGRLGIVRLLMIETSMVTLFAFALAIGMFYALSDVFARLLNFDMLSDIGISAGMWWEFLALYVIVALVSGIYPASYLSRVSPMQLIRQTEVRKNRLTVTSVVVQFSVVIFCIASLLVIWRQLDYVNKLPLGFDSNNVLCASVNARLNEYGGLRSELLQSPFIEEVALSQVTPLNNGSGQSIRRNDQAENEKISVEEHRIGPGYLKLYGIHLLQGRDFSESLESEQGNVILSETTATALGLEDPVGKRVSIWSDDPPYTVIGIAKDVVPSAHSKAGNYMYTAYARNFTILSVKFLPGQYPEAKSALLEVLEKHYKGIPINTFLITDLVRNAYYEDEIAFRILVSGTVLAILLALLGLLALCGFAARQKRKEISIRRVAGATISEIVLDLNRYILFRILPAIPIGMGLSYYVMYRWLNGFEYAITLSGWFFVVTLVVTLFIVIVTTFYQCLKAASANPVDSLKSE